MRHGDPRAPVAPITRDRRRRRTCMSQGVATSILLDGAAGHAILQVTEYRGNGLGCGSVLQNPF